MPVIELSPFKIKLDGVKPLRDNPNVLVSPEGHIQIDLERKVLKYQIDCILTISTASTFLLMVLPSEEVEIPEDSVFMKVTFEEVKKLFPKLGLETEEQLIDILNKADDQGCSLTLEREIPLEEIEELW